MLHGVGTLMARSLRLEARLLRTHLFRLVFVFIIYFMMMLAQVQSLMMGAPGLYLFQMIITLNALFIALGGIGFFATAITEEKEEETIGLLMMAGISPLGILFGKSTARMCQALLLVAVQFPFTLLAITLGGVLINQVLAAYASLLVFTILLANVALLASVVCRYSGTAMGVTTLVLLAQELSSLFLPPVSTWLTTQPWMQNVAGQSGLMLFDVIAHSGLSQRLTAILQTGFADRVFGTQVIFDLVVAAVCFLLSWLLFTKFALRSDAATPSRGLLQRRTGMFRWFAAGRAWSNPLVWKDFHFLTGGNAFAVLKFVLYGLALGVILGLQWSFPTGYGDPWEDGLHMHFAVLLTGLLIEAAISASRIFMDEIRMQTMVNLLTLPRSIAYVAYSKVLGCAVGLLPGLVWVGIDVTCFLPNGFNDAFETVTSPGFWVSVVVLNLFLHLTVLLSLFVKWGALPLAFLITLMSSYCCPIFLIAFMFAGPRGNDAEAALIVIGILWIMLAVSAFVFQMMIHARLYELGTK
jgi:ABC-type transport system involved in multi-copper enzyme maturation permease subunit